MLVYNATKVKCSVICPSLIKTKMFQGMHNPNEFFAPSLKPKDIAQQLMADAILSCESKAIVCPPTIGTIVAFLRA